MNAHQEAFEVFQTFPAEVWAGITPYLPVYPLLRLKLTGSKWLWHRLCSPYTVSQVKVDSFDFDFKRWPALLGELATLESLEISNRKEEFWEPSAFKISLFPKTLLKLKVGLSLDDSFFGGLSFSDCIPQLEELHFTSPKVNVAKYLGSSSKLKYLRLNHWFSEPLPPELIQLHVVEELNAKAHIKLSASLEVIVVGQLRGAENLFPLLSPNLRIFKANPPFFCERDYYLAKEQLDSLPRKLVELQIELPPSCLVGPPGKLLPEFHCLKILEIQILPAQYWVHLPQTLEKLVLACRSSDSVVVPRVFNNPYNGVTFQFQTIPIHDLPKSITSLSLTIIPGNVSFRTSQDSYLAAFLDCDPTLSATSNALFPPNLTYLKLIGSLISLNAAKHLPPTLAHLHIDYLDTNLCELLPKTLLSLQVRSCPQMVPLFFQRLPESLTSLELQTIPVYQLRVHVDFATEWSQVVKMTSFGDYTSSEQPIWTQDSWLPPNLTYFSMSGYPVSDFSFPNRNLQNLKTLIVDCDTTVRDSTLSNLPPNLTYLHLIPIKGYNWTGRNITGACFGVLPRGLRSFILEHSGTVMDSQIQNLPRGLEYLRLYGSSELTKGCIKYLPIDVSGLRDRDGTGQEILKYNRFYFQGTWEDRKAARAARIETSETTHPTAVQSLAGLKTKLLDKLFSWIRPQ